MATQEKVISSKNNPPMQLEHLSKAEQAVQLVLQGTQS